MFTAAVDNLAVLAVEEINAEGGVRANPVELIVGDDATDPATGVAEARRLVRAGCRTIMVSTTSATFAAVKRALADSEVLVVQTLMNEGGARGPLCVQLGERHEDQLVAAAQPVMRMAGRPLVIRRQRLLLAAQYPCRCSPDPSAIRGPGGG